MNEPGHDDDDGERLAGAPRGRRRTVRQRAVLATLTGDDRFRSAQQIYLDLNLRGSERIGLTTIYRVLNTLAVQQVVESQRAEHGETLYRLRSDDPGHHHHLLCRQCGRAVPYHPHDLERDAIRFAASHGFADITHHIDVYGTCPQCQAR